jgi:hypothetical protein
MASIRPYQTKTGKRRYQVRYRDRDGRQRSQAFSTHEAARAFKLELERKRPATRGQPSSDKVEGRRLFNEGEVRQWLRSRHGAGR